jgi:hypothetical protein
MTGVGIEPTTYGLKGTSETGRFVRISGMNQGIVC